MRTWAVVLLLLVGAPAVADARGGNYRGPNPAVPPMVREPLDPTPSPPLPFHAAPGPVVPPVVRGPGPPPIPKPSAPRARDVTSFVDWRFWYHHNQEVLEPRPPEALKLARDTEHTHAAILPAVLWVLDPKQASPPPVRHAALIALGKVATTSEHVALLRKQAVMSADLVEDESAILALGLLRRSRPNTSFPASLLDPVREDLFAILANNLRPVRQRAFAAVAIGLLGDQPMRSARPRAALAGRLLALLEKKVPHPDVHGSILLAVGLLPRLHVSPEQCRLLRRILETGEIAGQRTYLGRAYAALTLGRVGMAADAKALVAALRVMGRYANGMRSAAIALGTLAPRLSSPARAELLRDLLPLLDPPEPDSDDAQRPGRLRDATQRCLLRITLARIAAVELEEAARFTPSVAAVEAHLRKTVTHGEVVERPYGALALAWLGQAARSSRNEERGEYLQRTGALLRKEVVKSKALPHRHRAAFAIALGMIGDTEAKETLRGLVVDHKQDWRMRGAAIRGLALLDPDDAKFKKILRELRHRIARSTAMRIDYCRGISRTGTGGSGAALLAELLPPRNHAAKGPAVVGLGDLGSRAVVPLLAAVVRDTQQYAYLRALAAAALGRIGDPETVPSLTRITAHGNWRASADFLNELYDLL